MVQWNVNNNGEFLCDVLKWTFRVAAFFFLLNFFELA